MEASVVSEKGMRPAMEDAHYLDLDFGGKGWVYGGIYDGHGGDYAARYAAENLHQIFLEKLLAGLTPQQAFMESYETVSADLKQQASGTAAADFFIKDGRVFVANSGDARAIIVSQGGIRQLTIDHRLDDENEKERVLSMGAAISYPYVVRGNQGLMTTRSLGDEHFKPVGVIALPSLNEYLISRDDFIMISACDGLWDFMSNEDTATLARRNPVPAKLAADLKEEVLVSRSGTDNLTIITVSLF